MAYTVREKVLDSAKKRKFFAVWSRKGIDLGFTGAMPGIELKKIIKASI